MIGEQTTTMLMAAGVALAAFVILRASWRRQNPAKAGCVSPADSSRERGLADAPAALLRWQVEMHETARDLKAELDSKLSALQTLVALARQERALLEKALSRLQARDGQHARGTLADIEELGDPAALDDAERLAEVAARVSKFADELPPDLFDRDRQSLAVSRLADQGVPPSSIAEHLHLPLGEVELLLSLRAS
jgi:hypothetical protein